MGITDEEIRELFRTAKQECNEDTIRMVEAANKTETNLRNLQFAIATFLFTFTLSIFERSGDLNSNIKLLILLAWIALILSILSGLLHVIFSLIFFANQAKIHAERRNLFSTISSDLTHYERTVEKSNALGTKNIPSTSSAALVIQTVFLILGFLLIFSAATTILFQ